MTVKFYTGSDRFVELSVQSASSALQTGKLRCMLPHSYDSDHATIVEPLKISKCCFVKLIGDCDQFSNVSISERHYLQSRNANSSRTSLNWRFCSKTGSKPLLYNTKKCHKGEIQPCIFETPSLLFTLQVYNFNNMCSTAFMGACIGPVAFRLDENRVLMFLFCIIKCTFLKHLVFIRSIDLVLMTFWRTWWCFQSHLCVCLFVIL